MKTSQYDSVAGQYEYFVNNAPMRKIDEHSIFKMTGDVTGKSILDLACGYGFFSTEFYQRGASKVVGVDISEKMIDIATRKATAENVAIQYIVSDVKDMGSIERFDIVTAIWLLNYASSLDELYLLLKSCYDNLKPGGRLIIYTINPDYALSKGNYTEYGFNVTSEENKDGCVCMQGEFITPLANKITFYRWSKTDYEKVLNKLSFSDIEWVIPTLPDESINKYPEHFWDVFRRNQLQIGLICRR